MSHVIDFRVRLPLELRPAEGYSPFGSATLYGFGEYPRFTAPLDGARGNSEPACNLFVGALHCRELF